MGRLWVSYGSIMGLLWVSYGSIMGLLRVDYGSLTGRLWVSYGSIMGLLRVDYGSIMGLLRVDYGSIMGLLVAMSRPGYFYESLFISHTFNLVAMSRSCKSTFFTLSFSSISNCWCFVSSFQSFLQQPDAYYMHFHRNQSVSFIICNAVIALLLMAVPCASNLVGGVRPHSLKCICPV